MAKMLVNFYDKINRRLKWKIANPILSLSKYENLLKVLDFVLKFYAESILFKFSYWRLIFKLRDSIWANI